MNFITKKNPLTPLIPLQLRPCKQIIKGSSGLLKPENDRSQRKPLQEKEIKTLSVLQSSSLELK